MAVVARLVGAVVEDLAAGKGEEEEEIFIKEETRRKRSVRRANVSMGCFFF